MADDWTRLAQAVRDRRERLGLTQSDAVNRSDGGISLATWRNIETAFRPPYRRSSLIAVCRVLGWTTESVDLIIKGGEPVEAQPEGAVTSSDHDERLDRLERELAELREQLGLPPRQRNGGTARSA